MKILFICASFYPNIGGVEKHVKRISEELIKQGHTISIITEENNWSKSQKSQTYHLNNTIATNNTKSNSAYNASFTNLIKKDDINIYYLNFGKNDWFKKFRIWYMIWKNRALIKNTEIVHCHDVFFWFLPFRLIYLNKPVYTTFHGYESYPIKHKARIIRKISEKLSWGNICIGDFIKKWYGTTPSIVSYGAVDINNQDLEVKLNKSAVFIGRLHEQTNILNYADAIDIIKTRLPDFKFLVIGDGVLRRYIEKRYKVLGFIKSPDKYYSIYQYSFVSRYLSILEAMSKRRLVFAYYDNPVKKDYLLMSPFSKYIITTNSSKDLADQVFKCLKNPEIEKELTNKAYNWVKGQTWEKMVNDYFRLWGK